MTYRKQAFREDLEEVTYEIERFAVVVDHVGFLRLILVSFLWDVLDEHEFIWLLAHHR